MSAETIERLSAALSDRYRIERELGAGGTATVYLAEDLKHHRKVALKVLHAELGVMLGPERFLKEIDVMASLQHPHILPLFDSGSANGLLFYVMPFVEGETLRVRLERERQLPVSDTTSIAVEVAEALAYAHAKGVVHRDIKPENILLQNGHALVADFGIAHVMGAVGEGRLTQTGISLGTPTYMSPEQAMGEHTLDGRSDVYSLACVAYEMLGGQAPFTGPTAQAIIARHALESVPSLSIIRNTVPPETEATIIKALAKAPADRYSSAGEFAEALRHPENQSALVATRVMRHRRSRWLLAAVGVVVALVLGVVAYVLRPHAAASPAVDSGPDPRRIAVLYFHDRSQDGALGYLADGLTEALINRLSTVPQLVVTSSGGSEAFQGSAVPDDSIARALNVGTLVEGSLERAGDDIRVAVKLDDASGKDLQHATFEMPVSRPIALKDTLAGQVARFLRERLGQAIQMRAERAGTSDEEAWNMLQRAKRLQRDGDSARVANDTATMLRKFAEADSTLAAAERSDPKWVAIPILRGTIRYWISRFYSGDQLLVKAWVDSGLVQAAQALRIAPENSDVLQLRGELRYWRWLMALEPDPIKARALLDSARKDLETATQLSSNQPEAWSILSHLYYQYGDVAGAKLAAQRAYNEDAYLKGVNLIVWRLFTTSFDLEQFPDAIHWCDIGAGRFPADPRFVECKLWMMATGAVKVEPAEPWAMVDSMVRLSTPPDRPYARLHGIALAAGGLFRAGLRDSAAHLLDRLDDRADVDPTRDVSQTAALVLALMGNADKAIASLELYLSANPARASDFDAEESWEWRTIRGDPRFQALTGHKPR